MKSARHLAVELLERTFEYQSYSHIVIDNHMMIREKISLQEWKFCSALYYGVIERKITLDHIISGLSSHPLDKLDSIILNILRCGIYQILCMDSVPDNAAVNESVSLAKEFRKKSASGMVNAILRNFIRNGKKYKIPKNETERMSLEYSAPVWLVESLTNDYGRELTENLLSDSMGEPPLYIRRNNLQVSEEEFIQPWAGNFEFEKSEYLPCCYKVKGKYLTNGVVSSDMFDMGWFHVQDLASQLCCHALNPTENDTVLDLCAAPGGKTFTMAEMMNNKGIIYAFDLYKHRVQLIESGISTLGLENVFTDVGNAAIYNSKIPQCTKILCDVPCSGIGAIRRKPEIKYKNPENFDTLHDIQYDIAEHALNYLAYGGEMVYSTCTLRKAENEEVVNKLLANHPEIQLVTLPEPLGSKFGSMASLFPVHFGSDGFFIAKFRKR